VDLSKLFALLLGFALIAGGSAAQASGLDEAFTQSTSGMKAQGARMKIIAQNIANATSTGQTPGSKPYRRKIILFKNKTDKK